MGYLEDSTMVGKGEGEGGEQTRSRSHRASEASLWSVS